MASVTGLLADLHGDCFRLLCTATGVDAPGLAVVARIAKRAGKITAATCRRLEKVDNAFAVARHLSSPKAASFQAALDAELRGEGGSVPGDLLGKDLQPTDQVQTAAQPGEHNSDMGKQDLVEDEATNGQDEAVASPEAGGPVVRSQALPMEQLAARSVIAFGGLAAGDLFSQATGLTMTSSTPSAPPGWCSTRHAVKQMGSRVAKWILLRSLSAPMCQVSLSRCSRGTLCFGSDLQCAESMEGT